MVNNAETIFWFRRDLRLDDNTALFHALDSGSKVLCVFIFDKHILKQLENPEDARVSFIYSQLKKIKNQLRSYGSDLLVLHGDVYETWENITSTYQPKYAFWNKDYEPYARIRDQKITELLQKNNCVSKTHKDHVVFEPGEILKIDGSPYCVYTPFSKKWIDAFETLPKHTTRKNNINNFLQINQLDFPSLESMGFRQCNEKIIPLINQDSELLNNYGATRDLVYLENGTSRLGIHLRFGTISIRQLVVRAGNMQDNTFLKELIWREFFIQLLWFYPHTINKSFKEKYDAIIWRTGKQADSDFNAWCQGRTGYPIVDAGMRELNQTGYMHNRVRMITASFLCKHLLIDWRRGERYFAQRLLDYELASNVGNWQWASSSGADAAPYFRIFNPYTQQEKFDPNNIYVNRWLIEYETDDYPNEIVDYKLGRERALETYKKYLD